MYKVLSDTVAALMRAEHSEEAATQVLRPMLQHAGEALASSRYGGQGHILRGAVLLRPGEGYRRFWSLDGTGQGTAAEELDPAPLLASATAWRSVVEHRCAISIDVTLGTLRSHPPPGTQAGPWKGEAMGAAFQSDESRQRFLGRQATHVCAFPLRTLGGSIEGMLSLEASCPRATGQAFIWPECTEALQLMADVATPYLLQPPGGRVPPRGGRHHGRPAARAAHFCPAGGDAAHLRPHRRGQVAPGPLVP